MVTLKKAKNTKRSPSIVHQEVKQPLTKNILVVEDTTIAQKEALFILKNFAHHIDLANTGKEALKLLEKSDYDLIFMDLGLPDIDGLTVTETIQHLHNKKNSKKYTPIIALTAYDNPTMKQHCLELGMDGFLSKPLTKEKVKRLLSKLK